MLASNHRSHQLLAKSFSVMLHKYRLQTAARRVATSRATKVLSHFFTEWRMQLRRARADKLFLEVARKTKSAVLERWKLFAQAQKLARSGNAHYERSLIRKAMVEWRKYIRLARRKKHDKMVALSFWKQSILRSSMHAWKLQFRLKTTLDRKRIQAMNKLFTNWRILFMTAQTRELAASAQAIRHYRLKLLSRSFYGWNTVISSRRRRKHLNSHRVSEFRKRMEDRALRKGFQIWRTWLQQRKTLSVRLEAARKYYRQRLVTLAFFEWQAITKSSNWEKNKSVQPPIPRPLVTPPISPIKPRRTTVIPLTTPPISPLKLRNPPAHPDLGNVSFLSNFSDFGNISTSSTSSYTSSNTVNTINTTKNYPTSINSATNTTNYPTNINNTTNTTNKINTSTADTTSANTTTNTNTSTISNPSNTSKLSLLKRGTSPSFSEMRKKRQPIPQMGGPKSSNE